MGKTRIFFAILLALVLIISASDATTRILLADDKPLTDKVSPSPAPNSLPVNKESNQNHLPKAVASPPDSDKNGAKNEEGSKSGDKSEGKNGKKDDKGKASDGPSKTREEGHMDKSQLEECDGLQKCKKHGWVACLQHSEIDSKELVIIVQNTGESTLDVNFAVPPSVATDPKMLILDKHSSKKVNISAGSTKNLTIALNAGKEECNFQIGTVPSVSDWIQQFPAYAMQLPPMYGAYFLFLAVFIAGGIWGCCKFKNRGRRAVDGVAYQQLEMGARTQPATEIVESSTADGWEQSWDDDWDEEATVRPSPSSPNGHVSSNGLASRSANKKNGRDIEWDD